MLSIGKQIPHAVTYYGSFKKHEAWNIVHQRGGSENSEFLDNGFKNIIGQINFVVLPHNSLQFIMYFSTTFKNVKTPET